MRSGCPSSECGKPRNTKTFSRNRAPESALTALVVSSIIGSGIFGLPSVVAEYVGKQSPLVSLLAAGEIGIVVACFAEVASQFDVTGGPYLYAREAFGQFIGIEVEWPFWLAKLTAAAAAASLFTNYLSEF